MKSVIQGIKPVVEFCFNLPLLITLPYRRKRRIYLFLSPEYMNYGDHGIALAELDILRERFPEYEIVDLNYSFFERWPERTRQRVLPGDVVILTGGGYMGSLWPINQLLTEKVITFFPENRILFAPQTLFFKPEATSDRDAFAELLKKHGNFFFFARDRRTCTQLQEMGLIEEMDYCLFPDFFIFNTRYSDIPQRAKYPILCLRKDVECVVDASVIKKIVVKALGKNPKDVTMAKDHIQIPTWLRSAFVKYKLRQYAEASVVISDRLHTMLFCAFTGTPCISFDNESKKVSGVYEWISSLAFIRIAETPKQVSELLDELKPYANTKQENRAAFLKCQAGIKEQYENLFVEQVHRDK